jgi:N-acetylmuramoyl-L-alanine amidase
MKIAIDAGHGMSSATPNVHDPGAVAREGGATFFESVIALEYANSLTWLLDQNGAETFMTRTSEDDPAPYQTRAARAEEAGCTHFVSIHLNEGQPNAEGVEVYYRRDDDASLAVDISKRISVVSKMGDRGAKKRPEFAVLHFNGPAVLIELGFITSKYDRDILFSGRPMRVAICGAIMEALGVSLIVS